MNKSLSPLTSTRYVVAIISLLLSVFAICTDTLINPDGVLYINAAQQFLNGGLQAAAQLYHWPFYSILIATVHTVSGLSLENSATSLNALFFVVFTDAVILISAKILPNQRQLIIAALLTLSFLALNDYREFIIRDIGYWAFSSLALYRFILFIESGTLVNATLWQLLSILALLFRIEGIVIIAALPLYTLLASNKKDAFFNYIKLNYLFFFSLLIGILFILSFSTISAGFSKFALIASYANIDQYLVSLHKYSDIIASQVLNEYSDKYSMLILVSGLIIMLIYKLLKSISLGYLALYLYARWENNTRPHYTHRGVLLYFLALNLLILTVFVLKQNFISSRYTAMAFTTILLLLFPWVCRLLEQAWLNKNKALLSLTALIILIQLADFGHTSVSKAYIKDSAHWASQNLPNDSRVLTDDLFIHYYISQDKPAMVDKHAVSPTHYKKYDYLILVVKKKNTLLKEKLRQFSIEAIQHFENKRHDQVIIYKVLK